LTAGGNATIILDMMTNATQIATLTKELQMREAAAAHLRGIPARQNASAIASLYDRLNALHIARLEGGR
jgi:hypothetical protein